MRYFLRLFDSHRLTRSLPLPVLTVSNDDFGLLRQSFAPPKTVRRQCPKMLVNLGELRGLIYRSDKEQCGRPRTYIHFMESPPLLASDPEGKQLYIVGGNYRVTSRGIEG